MNFNMKSQSNQFLDLLELHYRYCLPCLRKGGTEVHKCGLPVVQVELHGAYAETFQRYMSARLISGSSPTSKSLLWRNKQTGRDTFITVHNCFSRNKNTLFLSILMLTMEELTYRLTGKPVHSD